MRFQNKIALITAAADGIARATAEIMAAEGATVVCVDNHAERLESAARALGANAHPHLCDALDQSQLASIAGRGMSVASGSAYAAAKGGIIAFTRKLSHELGPFSVNINAIAPSLTLTERIAPHWNQRSPEAQAAQIDSTPLRRVALASDQAKVICFLASSDADFVTGLTIDVTGGL